MSESSILSKREQSQAVLDALNARDWQALAVMPFHPEYEFRSAIGSVEGEVYVGVQGLRAWAESVDSAFDGFHIELLECREAGDEQAVLLFRLTGTARGSGIALDTRLAHLATWREGEFWCQVAYADSKQAFEAAGPAE